MNEPPRRKERTMLEDFMNRKFYIKLTKEDEPLLPELKEIIGLDWNSGADFVTATPRIICGHDPVWITTASMEYFNAAGKIEKREGPAIVFTWYEPENFVDAETFIRKSKRFEIDQNQYDSIWEHEFN